jgi:hypothetical protein
LLPNKQDKEAKVEVKVVYNLETGHAALDDAYGLLAKFLLENDRNENGKGEVAGA